jgi:hypothetical protein
MYSHQKPAHKLSIKILRNTFKLTFQKLKFIKQITKKHMPQITYPNTFFANTSHPKQPFGPLRPAAFIRRPAVSLRF